MIRLEESKVFGRKIRQDDWSEIGIPTWTLAHEAIQGGRIKEALELFEYAHFEVNSLRHHEMGLMNLFTNYIVYR